MNHNCYSFEQLDPKVETMEEFREGAGADAEKKSID